MSAVEREKINEQSRQLSEAKKYFGYSEDRIAAIKFIEERINEVNDRIEAGVSVLETTKLQITNLRNLKKEYETIKLHYERGKF